MNENETLPTTFAISLGEESGILLKNDRHLQDHHDYFHLIELMRTFQKMSVSCAFQEALYAFHGVELSKEQKSTLEVIYKSTKYFMKGHVVSVLMDKLDSGRMSNRDFAESIKAIIDLLTDPESESAKEKQKGLVVRFTTKKEKKNKRD